MSDVMLPWPKPRRTDNEQSRQAQAAPHYEIQRVYDDGSTEPVEVLPIVRPPWAAKSGRRGFLGAGIATSVAAAFLLTGCNDSGGDDSGGDDPDSPDSSSPTTSAPSSDDSDSEDTDTYDPDTDTYDPDTYDPETDDTETDDTETDDTDTYDPDDGTYGGGGQICTCNKVCVCIPVCQAHQLLNPDPIVRRMAATVVVAMGPRELPYLRWAASEAPAPLRTRIDELIGELLRGRCLCPDDLADPGCEPYLASGDPVIAMMAAQVLTLRALSLGTGLSGVVAQRAAEALTTGGALHLERAPAWSR